MLNRIGEGERPSQYIITNGCPGLGSLYHSRASVETVTPHGQGLKSGVGGRERSDDEDSAESFAIRNVLVLTLSISVGQLPLLWCDFDLQFSQYLGHLDSLRGWGPTP